VSGWNTALGAMAYGLLAAIEYVVLVVYLFIASQMVSIAASMVSCILLLTSLFMLCVSLRALLPR
jgi:hypothetical protein